MAALAAKVDVEKALRRALTEEEEGDADIWVNAALDEASILVRGFCGQNFEGEVPDAVRVVTARVAARDVTATRRTDSVTTLTDQADIWQRTVAFEPGSTSGGVWLTKTDKAMLGPWAVGGGAYAVDTVTGGSVHSEACSINFGGACSCGVDIAGFPLWESLA